MRRSIAVALLALLPACATTKWNIVNGERRASRDGERRVVELAPIGGNRPGSNVAMALVDGARFDGGAIDVDLRGNGGGQASFVGVAFAVAEPQHYEAIYFRPFNFRAEDAVHRAHAVQYIAWPEHTWERLRRESPGRYESALEPAPDPERWFHARIEVDAAKVRVFVDGAARPCLVVDRLGERRRGGVGLWVDSQPGAFANLKITSSAP